MFAKKKEQFYFPEILFQKKFAQSVALGFQFVKELDSSFPATKFAEILVSLDRYFFAIISTNLLLECARLDQTCVLLISKLMLILL